MSAVPPSGRRALIVVPPTRGHLNSAIALSGLLRQACWQPTVVSSPQIARTAADLGLGEGFRSAESMFQETDRRAAGRRSHLEQSLDAQQLAVMIAELTDLIGTVAAGMVVAKDSFAARVAAARSGCAYLGFFTDGVDSLLAGRSRQTAPAHLLSATHIAALATELGICGDDAKTVVGLMRAETGNIVRGFPEHDRHHDASPAASRPLYAGFLTFDDTNDKRASWERRFATVPKPAVYVTFGTVCADPNRYHVATEAAGRAGAHLLLSTSPFMPAELGISGDQGAIFDYIPADSALRVADVVVHHGGFGTTLAALAAGVPSVVIPENSRTNQDRHGALLCELGVGVLLPPDQLSARLLAHAITGLMSATVGHRAAALSRDLRTRSRELQGNLVQALANADLHAEELA